MTFMTGFEESLTALQSAKIKGQELLDQQFMFSGSCRFATCFQIKNVTEIDSSIPLAVMAIVLPGQRQLPILHAQDSRASLSNITLPTNPLLSCSLSVVYHPHGQSQHLLSQMTYCILLPKCHTSLI